MSSLDCHHSLVLPKPVTLNQLTSVDSISQLKHLGCSSRSWGHRPSGVATSYLMSDWWGDVPGRYKALHVPWCLVSDHKFWYWNSIIKKLQPLQQKCVSGASPCHSQWFSQTVRLFVTLLPLSGQQHRLRHFAGWAHCTKKENQQNAQNQLGTRLWDFTVKSGGSDGGLYSSVPLSGPSPKWLKMQM